MAEQEKYAWEGSVIKLNQKDFDLWQKSNPLVDLPSYLCARDAWLRDQPQEDRKRWFYSTACDLLRQTEKRNSDVKRNDGVAMWFGGIKIREQG